MAVVYERVSGSADLVMAYSNAGMMIRKDGTEELYTEAVDPDYMNRTYTETDIPVESDEPMDAQDAIDMIFGEEQ